MADEAFALSPISARASLPSEEDYEAISQAFMETSRGRWFLGEYAKRNRNADTCMVLDAVARIEETLAAQKQPAPESGLTEALAAIRHAVDEAQAAASAAVQSLTSDGELAPVRKGARIIREISWRWREIGADARICDLLDSQVDSIEEACGQISSARPQTALGPAFDLIKARIAQLGDSDTAPPQAAKETVASPSSAAPRDETPAVAIVATAEAAKVTAEVTDVPAEALDVRSEAEDENPAATEAYDDALLDAIALEMAAPDPDDIDDAGDAADGQVHVAEASPAEPILVAEMPAPMAAPAQPPAVQPSLQPPPEVALQASLGSTLIANGIVRTSNPLLSDPLAPIRRMSQAEKIAFFS